MAEEVNEFDLYLKQGEKLNLTGESLQKYIYQCMERKERFLVRQRAEEKEAQEKLLEVKRLEQEMQLKEKKLEQELQIQREVELAKVEAERELKREQLNLQAQQGLLPKADEVEPKPYGPKPAAPRNYPKLPVFKENVDSMDSFLARFEAHAKASNWPEKDWPVLLSAVLDGEALNLFHTFQTLGNVDYKELKEMLLIKYQCDAEGFRQKLRSIRPESGESFRSFGTRMVHLLQRWVELSKTDKTFEALTQLILTEQFLGSVCKDLQVFLKEKNLNQLDKMIESAENFRMAHPNKMMARNDKTATPVSTCFGGASNYQQHKRGQGPQRGTGRGWQNGHAEDYRNFQGRRGAYRGSRRGRYSNDSRVERSFKCNICEGYGHFSKVCPSVKTNSSSSSDNDKKPTGLCTLKTTTALATKTKTESEVNFRDGSLLIETGRVNGTPVSVVNDSGAVTAGVRKSLVLPHQYTGQYKTTWSFGGNQETFPLAIVQVETERYNGNVCCCVIDSPVIDLLIGNLEQIEPIPGLFGKVADKENQRLEGKLTNTVEAEQSVELTNPTTNPVNISHTKPTYSNESELVENQSEIVTAAVSTRAQEKRDQAAPKPLKTTVPELNVDKEELIRLQKEDAKLTPLFELASSGQKQKHGKITYCYTVCNGILYRSCESKGGTTKQIVVPAPLTDMVLAAAHDTLISGHCSKAKTLNRIKERFFWHGMSTKVRDYCKSCDICQKTQPKSKTRDIPLEFMPRIDYPFKRVAIDLVGPLHPSSEEKHTHILTIIDIATRYPEAIPLKKTDSVTVAEALFSVFSRMGIPEEILSDNGSQFTSEMMKEFHELLSIKGVHSSPYHAQSNGVIERFHGTLKPMLKKVIVEQPRQWHRYIPALLFAVRELPNASTGFSPFEMMFGRQPRGPIDLLANAWSGGEDAKEAKTTYQHVVDLKNSIYDMCKIAHDSVDEARKTQKFYHDKKARFRSFSVGDEVLLLRPTSANKLQMQWQGPFKVVEILNNDYKIDVHGEKRLYHANLLKKYIRRDCTMTASKQGDRPVKPSNSSETQAISYEEIVGDDMYPQHETMTATAILMQEDEEEGKLSIIVPETPESSVIPDDEVRIDDTLDPDQIADAKVLVEEMKDCLKNAPGASKGKTTHDIRVTTEIPVRRKPYPLPFAATQEVCDEVKELLDQGIIERSTSPYCSPIVLVPKKGTNKKRLCLDLRALNAITIFDAEPILDQEEIFTKLAGKKYFTKIDLCKGYFQIFITGIRKIIRGKLLPPPLSFLLDMNA